jgi:tetratricopeptide (TPR) repeat protein
MKNRFDKFYVMKKNVLLLFVYFCLFSCGCQEKKDAIYYYNQGILCESEDYHAAYDLYNRAIAMDSTNASFYSARGNIKSIYLNDIDGALEDYRKAIGLDSLCGMVYSNIGVLFAETGKKQEAMFYYQQAIEKDPDYPLSYNNLGFSYYEQGDYQNALPYFEKYLTYDTNDLSTLYSIGMCHKMLGNKIQARRYLISARNAGSPEAILELSDLGE